MVDNTMLMDLMDAYLTECEIRKLAPKTILYYNLKEKLIEIAP